MANTHTFGPATSPWTYNRFSHHYSLSPASPTIISLPSPTGTTFSFDPFTAALVIVDMQNYFLDPKCTVHPTGLAAVQSIVATIRKCRNIGIKVVWLNWCLSPHDLVEFPAAIARSFMTLKSPYPIGVGDDMGEDRGRKFIEGSWNADVWPGLKREMREGDAKCGKNRMSGFWNDEQSLRILTKRDGIKTLIFAGVNTDQCVLGTLTDAYNAGLNCILLSDCCATTTPGGQEVTVHNVSHSYGFVTHSDAFVAANLESV